MDTGWSWAGVFGWCMFGGKGDGSWAKCDAHGLGDGDMSKGCCLHHALSLHIEPNCSLCKVCHGKPAILMCKGDGPQQACGFPSGMQRRDTGSTQQLWPRSSVSDGPTTPIPACTPPPLHSAFPPSRSSNCFPTNYFHKLSAEARDKSSGTEWRHAPDLSHRWTNGAGSTRREHKGAVPAGALTPPCHSYLLLRHNGPAALAGLPG